MQAILLVELKGNTFGKTYTVKKLNRTNAIVLVDGLEVKVNFRQLFIINITEIMHRLKTALEVAKEVTANPKRIQDKQNMLEYLKTYCQVKQINY